MKDVILIGLGEFGEKTVELFNDIQDERRSLLPPELRDSVDVHSLVFKGENSFNYKKVSERIIDLVKDTETKQFKGKFSYVIVGDLYDDMTSNYAVDYAAVPRVLDMARTQLLDHDNLLGYFTYSDQLGSQIACSSQKMASIVNFFKKCEKTGTEHKYKINYKDVSGNQIPDISCSQGIFTRNYVLATPGNQDSVMKMTSQVFAERIFYELYYLLDEFKDRSAVLAARNQKEKENACFSTFTMIEISRLKELQQYFLTYTLEDKVSSYLLSKEIKGTNLDVVENKVLKMFDIIDADKESSLQRQNDGYHIPFPMDRAVKLFMKSHKGELSHILPSYINKDFSDVREYVKSCKDRINEKTYDLKTQYDGFVNEEINNMLSELEKGYVSLFRIKKLTGNMNTYIKYIEDLKNIFEGWRDDLEQLTLQEDEIDIEQNYEKVQKKIKRYQKNPLYKLPFFIPVRRMLINNAILELPIEKYIKNEIKKNLARSFYIQWKDTSENSRTPIHICENLIVDLKKMKERLEKKQAQIVQKEDFIKNVPLYYYIISQKKDEEYAELLTRVYDKNFGAAKMSQIEVIAKKLFSSWTMKDVDTPKDRQSITKDPSGFIRHVDKFISEETKIGFGIVEYDEDEFNHYADSAVDKMLARSAQLAENTFFTGDSLSYLDNRKILFTPVLQNTDDHLVDKLNMLPKDVVQKEVNKDFTMGSSVYFLDFLYMPWEKMQQYETFRRFAEEKSDDLVYEEAGQFEADDDQLSLLEQHTRSLLLDYQSNAIRKALFKSTFGVDKDELSDKNINALAKAVKIEDLLEGFDLEQLHKYAREYDIQISNEKERQIKSIVFTIKSAEGE